MARRYCYRCGRRTLHECGAGKSGDYMERCAECGHVNRVETWEWRLEEGRLRRWPEPGATLRQVVRV